MAQILATQENMFRRLPPGGWKEEGGSSFASGAVLWGSGSIRSSQVCAMLLSCLGRKRWGGWRRGHATQEIHHAQMCRAVGEGRDLFLGSQL